MYKCTWKIFTCETLFFNFDLKEYCLVKTMSKIWPNLFNSDILLRTNHFFKSEYNSLCRSKTFRHHKMSPLVTENISPVCSVTGMATISVETFTWFFIRTLPTWLVFKCSSNSESNQTQSSNFPVVYKVYKLCLQ